MNPHHQRVVNGTTLQGAPALPWIAFLAAALLLLTTTKTSAQPQGAFDKAPEGFLQPRIAKPRGETLRRLERLAQLAERESWDDTCEIADQLLAEPTEGWVEVEPDRYIGVREAVHRRVAALPLAGLAAYRARIDPLANDWLQEGIDARNEQLLQQVANRAFCSTAGDDALWALGEIALERGDYQSARAACQSLHAETAAPGALVYPDTAITLANIKARLALVSLREGDLHHASQEIAAIAADHPDAVGRLGGREVNYAMRLAELLTQARDRPPVASPQGAPFEQAWSIPISIITPSDTTIELLAPPTIYPAIADGAVVYQDAAGIQTVPLSSDNPPTPRTLFAAPQPDFPSSGTAPTVADRKLFAVVPAKPARTADPPATQLIALDLARDGALLLQIQPEDPAAQFLGPPVVTGSHIVVYELTPAQGMKASVVCYDLWTKTVRWRRLLGWAVDASATSASFGTSAAMAEDAGVVFVNTNLGVIAAIRIADGQPLWLRTYPRSLPSGPAAAMLTTRSPPNLPVVSGSQIIVAPSDSANVMALDAATGATLWSTPKPAAEARILAVADDQVLLNAERLWSLSAATGEIDTAWNPENFEAFTGAGQGALAGNLILWPTITDVLLLDRHTGKPAGQPLPLPTPGGANLVIMDTSRDRTEGALCIVAASPDRLTAYRSSTNADPTPDSSNAE